MKISNEKIKDLLVGPGHLSMADFKFAQNEARKEKMPLEQLLVEKGLIPDENLGKTIADGFGYHFIDLKTVKIPKPLLELIPEVAARAQQAIVFKKTKDSIQLASPHPDNYEFIKLLERQTGREVKVYYATPTGIEYALQYYKSDLRGRVEALIAQLKTKGHKEENIVELVNVFLEYAYDSRASDIHIEPLKNETSVRFRVDGVLHRVVDYPREFHDKIVFRIKIMARLRTDEHAAAQDGRFDYKMRSTPFDVRVSILPITHGENVVLRLLAERSRRLSLEELGLLAGDLKKLKRAAKKPSGMLLAVGPTGSGKTTTLYAILEILNKPEVNIMTIEDPVEYTVDHVQQTQVNAKKNLVFSSGLRSIVRQDPDIIMVGEIRDKETDDIAVNAAMTGHLLLSTLHANDAATTFPRLIDMGAEPFLISSSVNVAIAQRLVRTICERCKMSYHLGGEELKMLEFEPQLSEYLERVGKKKDFSLITLYKGAGCRECGDSGYSGRIGIFEVMEVSGEIRTLITQRASSDLIYKKARELGMTSMLNDGVIKALQGTTTLEEIIRATRR